MEDIVYRDIVAKALLEDIGSGDLTTNSIFSNEKGEAFIIAKERGVLAGLSVAAEVFAQIDKEIEFVALLKDGDSVEVKDKIAQITGKVAAILTAERVALNFLQRMSGIATETKKATELIRHTRAKVVDTRKTTPGLRILEKYSVRVGGGFNHRFNLSDMVLIKDNHIKGVESLTEAVLRARSNTGFTTKIEVETASIEQVKEALDCGVDIIMLDNMSISNMTEAVRLAAGNALIEASGGITYDRLLEVANTGVDIISLGYLTSSITVLDMSLILY